MANSNPSPKTRWKSGESGNPNGRPKKGQSLTDILREQAKIKDAKFNGEMVERKVALGNRMWMAALKGDVAIMKYMYDRLDGKPTQEIKVQSDVAMDAPIVLHVGATIRVVEDESDDDNEGDESSD
jgi:hypothetical protein